MHMIPCTISDQNITLIIDAKPFTLPSTDERFKPLAEAAVAGDILKCRSIIHAYKQSLEDLEVFLGKNTKVEYRYGYVFVNGQPDDGAASRRIIELRKRGLPIRHLMAFLARLSENPSHNSATQLFDFVTRNDLPIDGEGFVIAFKAVRDDFKDFHSGTFDNSVGRIVSMPRQAVDDNSGNACSTGLHVSGERYAADFRRGSGQVVLVRIDPADFVAVPRDSSQQKARVCRYEVIGVMERAEALTYFTNRSRVTHEGWRTNTGEIPVEDTRSAVTVEFEDGKTLTNAAGTFSWSLANRNPIKNWKHA